MLFSAILILLWILIIRPYCLRNGRGYTPGATLAATAWIDWQEASELARDRGHRRMRIICGIFLAMQILVYVFAGLAILGALLAQKS